MLEFKVIENLKPNKNLTNLLKDFKYRTNKNYHTHQSTSNNTYWIPNYISYYSYNTWIQS